MPVQTVHGDVQLSAKEPLRMRRVPLTDRVPRLRPLQLRRLPGPKRFGIGGGGLVNLGIAPIRLSCEIGERGEFLTCFLFELCHVGCSPSILMQFSTGEEVRRDSYNYLLGFISFTNI